MFQGTRRQSPSQQVPISARAWLFGMTFSLVLWTLLAGAADVAFGAERNATPGCVSISEFRAVHSRPNHSPRVSWTRREFNWFVGATPLRWREPFAAQEQDVPVTWRYAFYRACYDLPGVRHGRSVVEVQYLKSRHLPSARRYTTADIFHW